MSINILSLAAFGFSICMFTSIYELRQKYDVSKYRCSQASIPPELKLIICIFGLAFFMHMCDI